MAALLAPAAARAATITPSITGTDEFGTGLGCSLREAIESANGNADFGGCTHTGTYGNDTVQLIGGVTYARTITGEDDLNASGDLDVRSNITFTVFGAGGAIIEGNGTSAGDRVLDLPTAGVSVSMSDVTIRNGQTASGDGGGIVNAAGGGSLSLLNSTVSGNTAGGGSNAGGIFTAGAGATTTLTNVTLSGNIAGDSGGGLMSSGGATTTLSNATVTNNQADLIGGDGGGTATNSGGTINLQDTIVAGNIAADAQCLGAETSLGHNLSGDSSCGFPGTTGDVFNTPAGVGPLASNGGSAQTHELLPGSAAIDAGDPAAPGSGGTACAANDQRGIPRPQGPGCDIGSYEVAAISPTTTADEFGGGGACGLREAIEAANTDGSFGGCSFPVDQGHDRILLVGGATYPRTINDTSGGDDLNASGDLDVRNEDLSIGVAGSGGAAIEGNGTAAGDRVLAIRPSGTGSPVSAAISGVTIRNGRADSGGAAGPIAGGILNIGSLNLTDTTVSGNSTSSTGGGIVSGGPTTLTNVTISGNSADNHAGGFAYDPGPGTATLNNVTVTANTADANAAGGGDGGGIFRLSGTLNLRNTIVAGNLDASPAGTVAPDCISSITSLGHNLIGDTANCTFAATTGDAINTPAGLAPLASNGGPTQTHALLAGSAAIDTANPAAPGSGGNSCAPSDQRGIVRPQGPRCDKGAFELEPPASTPNTPTAPRFDLAGAIKKCKKKFRKGKKRKKCIKKAKAKANRG